MPLFLLRHGETDYNLKGVCQGQIQDSELTKKGRKQAREAGSALAKIQFDEIHCSDLKRALQTLEILGEFIDVSEAKITTALREKYQGELEGLAHTDPRWQRYQELLSKCAEEFPEFNPQPESPSAFAKRGADYLNKLDRNKNILIVSHGGIVRNYRAHAQGMPLGKYLSEERTNLQVKNGEFVVIA